MKQTTRLDPDAQVALWERQTADLNAHKRKLEKVQSNEDWPLRAVKLQLLEPHTFDLIAGRYHWHHAMLLLMHNTTVLTRIGFGIHSPYRLGLLSKSLPSHSQGAQST